MTRRRATLATALALALAALLPAAARAETYEAPCVPYEAVGPICTFWEGTAGRIEDGDSLHVRIDGLPPSQHIRITGIQTMELSVHGRLFRAGECHAVEAANRVQELIDLAGGVVRISAMDERSISGDRPRRSVAALIRGRWVDIGRTLLREGLALWLPSRSEWAWNARYSTYAERAAVQGVGLWSNQACGFGPNEGQPIAVTVNGDGDRIDSDDLISQHGEWVRVTNKDPVNPLPLGGWWLRDSDLRQYDFPDGFVLPPGATVTVHVGPGVDDSHDLHWGLGGAVFDNVDRARELGDGAYLFDPHGDLRAWMTYPCRTTCADANAGALELIVDAQGREQIGVRNVGTQTIDLGAYVVSATSHRYAFTLGTLLAPGETMRIVPGREPARDEPLLKGWGKGGGILRNRGGAVRLSTHRGAVLACAAWGAGSC